MVDAKMTRKATPNESKGFDVWEDNQLIAVTDEDGNLRARSAEYFSDWQLIGQASTVNEIYELLDAQKLKHRR